MNFTPLVSIFLVLFLLLLVLSYIYDYTEKFTNFQPLANKLNPLKLFGIEKYVVPNYVPPELDHPQPSSCVCVFDLDHTLTCGDAKPIVDICKQKGCKLAINTARPTNWVSDIPLGELGFEKPWYDPRDHYFNPRSYEQTLEQIANTKSNFLGLVRDKYKVANSKCVILFDDSPKILQTAETNGFSTIAASEPGKGCGIHRTKMDELGALLGKC